MELIFVVGVGLWKMPSPIMIVDCYGFGIFLSQLYRDDILLTLI